MSSFDTSDRDNVWSNKTFLRYGLWRAKVLQNVDTQARGRIQVRVLHLHPEPITGSGALVSSSGSTSRPDSGSAGPGTNRATEQGVPDNLCPWAEPAFPFGGNTGEDAGFFMLPAVGSTVWVAFEMGFSGNLVWIGSWLGSNEIPSDVNTLRPADFRIIKTPMGHKLLFSDDTVTPNPFVLLQSSTGHFLKMDEKPGQILVDLKTAGGHEVKLNDTTHKVTVQSTLGHKVEIDDAANSITASLSSAPNTKMELTPAAATISIGTNTIVLTVGGILTITTTGVLNVNSAGVVNLGVGATKGVCVDSLLTVMNNFMGVYNAHTHVYSPGPGAPTPTAGPSAPGVAGVVGVDTSTTVLARAP